MKRTDIPIFMGSLLVLGGCASDTTDFLATELADGTFELALPQDSVNIAWQSAGLPLDGLVFNWGKKLCGRDAYRIADAGIRKRLEYAYPEHVWKIDCKAK